MHQLNIHVMFCAAVEDTILTKCGGSGNATASFDGVAKLSVTTVKIPLKFTHVIKFLVYAPSGRFVAKCYATLQLVN